MLMDMCAGIELDMRDNLDVKLANLAIRTLNHALQFGPLSHDTEWCAAVTAHPPRTHHVRP